MSPPCIVCGDKEEFFQHLCQSCFLESNPILKEKKDLDIVICLSCGLLAFKGHWSKFFINDLSSPKIYPKIASFIQQEWDFFYRPAKIKIQNLVREFNEDDELESLNGKVLISASPDVFVPLLTIIKDFTIDLNWGDCSDCQTRSSGLYTSKIQIRSQKNIEPEVVEQWGDEIDKISKEFPLSDGKNPLFRLIQIKNGLDALFRSKSAAQSIGRIFARDKGGLLHLTTEFAGFDKSKSKEYPRKQVVLITLPKYQEGDYILLEDQVFRIKGYSNFKVACLDVINKTIRRISVKTFDELDPKPFDSPFEEYQVVNFETTEKLVQIMNLTNYESHYVDSTELKGLSEGDSFWGIIYEGRIILREKSDKKVGVDKFFER
jgi:NMD protein affecting ribosome stability and mRNA decay